MPENAPYIHKICEQKFGEHKVHILSKILMVTFFGELLFTFCARPLYYLILAYSLISAKIIHKHINYDLSKTVPIAFNLIYIQKTGNYHERKRKKLFTSLLIYY
ncbi:hypothetical protein BpHYR1_018669 [Brachionus plicatilis]|uniref:Uncharacterized protein n=1 Tax=Brachionus plicatilis TaxID=10195 RepID=A0A3M7T561_BRAPC|nr:hypothetical protein BpHYR1_018669 [Brachionus plicatilis]